MNTKIKTKPTTSRIVKTIIDNSKEHLAEINKTLEENNTALKKFIRNSEIHPSDILNFNLLEIIAKNNHIINSNKLFSSVEVIVNYEEDCN